jgi:hypothetical protein
MIFRSEADVRKWLRTNGGRRKLFWIEHRVGGTAGNLDCLVALNGKLIPIECKKGKWDRDGFELKYELRADQKQVIRRLTDNDIDSWVLVGELYSERLWLRPGIDAVKNEGEWKRVESWEWLMERIK